MDISRKTNRVLHFIFLCLMLILIRTWHLSIVQHDYHSEQAKKPQRRLVIEKADRATIHDRFGIPLAVNKIQYNAAVCFANIRQIPSVLWKKSLEGKKIRIPARTEYIMELACMLSRELGLDVTKIEDIIHGKAALLPHTPFVIKEDISEEQYYRLRMLEKEWVGLQAQRVSRRCYPFGKVGCDVLGYLGTIDQSHYFRIAHELRTLEDYLIARERNENPFLPEGFNSPEEVDARFIELQEKAYTMNDLVGKSGVEASYEEALRGYYGKHIFEIDTKGNRLQELPGSRKALPGKKLTLTLSIELQDFAEKLLASIEGSRLENGTGALDEKWMRGGAVVAMIPQTGEIVALSSYPRFDPNDFVPTRDPELKDEKEFAVKKWLENEGYIGAIWDGKRPIEREYFSFTKGKYIEEKIPLTLERYLEAILPSQGPVKNAMQKIDNVRTAIQIQECGIVHPLLREISSEEDRLFILDLCHLLAPKDFFDPQLVVHLGHLSLTDHYQDRQHAMQFLSTIKHEIRELFYDYDFMNWRQAHFKEYLKRKRQEEKEQKRYAKPYTDYLDRIEKKFFGAFWDAYKAVFLYTAFTGKVAISLEDHSSLQPYFASLKAFNERQIQNNGFPAALRQKLQSLSPIEGVAYLKTLRSFEDLNHPLQGNYPTLRSHQGKKLEKHLASAFYPQYGYGFSRSQAFRQTSAQGSVFKLVTAYQVMMERYEQQKNLNPFTVIDDLKGNPRSNSNTQVLGYTIDGTALYRSYKGGRLPRSSHGGIGKIDLVGALEQSSNIYFALLASDYMQDPMNLARAARAFGLGEKTGIDLPYESKGNVPDDLHQNRTGLYSFSIGQHTLEVTPLHTAVMLGTVANQGKVVRPRVVKQMEGPERVLHHELLTTFSSDKLLTKTVVDKEENIVYHLPTTVKRTLAFPSDVFRLLTAGMHRVVVGAHGTARPAIMRNFSGHPSALRDYIEVHQDLLAKTGTAQVRYKQSQAKTSAADMKNNVWFAAIAYPKKHLLSSSIAQDPELVVVVFLRFRQAGREGGTIAAQVVQKWRDIQAEHQQ